MFDFLGLGDLEARVYDHLLDVSTTPTPLLATSLGVTATELEGALASLEQRGLAVPAPDSPTTWTATPPDLGLGAIIATQQAALQRAQLGLPAVTERFRAAAGGRVGTDLIDTIHGAEAVAQRFAQLQRNARREVLVLVRPTVAVVSALDNVEEDIGVARGVDYRVVLGRKLLEREGFVADAQTSQDQGVQLRVVDEVPLRMIVVDRELGLLPLATDDDPHAVGALLVRRGALLDAMVTLFHFVWESGRHLHLTGEDMARGRESPIDDVDAKILSMLLVGLTDQAIGKQLGLSMRTVQRRVHQLMERVRVSTRLGLGYEVARRGWM